MHSYSEVLKSSIEYFDGDVLAASTVAKKYLLRDKSNFLEINPGHMHARLASEFARVEAQMSGVKDPDYHKTILSLMSHFRKVVPQGSPMAAVGNDFQLQSLSNCFVISSPVDSIPGIFKTGLEMAEIQKRRGGVGTDISTLRPFGSNVNNAALVSGGTPGFSDFFSYITRMIGQLGRQGALMITLNIKHPDSERFATMKKDLTKVTGANVSLMVTDEFMRAVEEDAMFTQQWPVNVPLNEAKVVKEIRARDLWDVIVENAWLNGEPGILMWDNYTRMLPAHNYPGFETVSTNPCSEIALSPYDSCRLISNNVYGWVKNPFTKDAYFDFNEFYRDVRTSQRMSDGLVELELEKIKKIVVVSDDPLSKDLWNKVYTAGHMGRRTGLGTHGLADCLLALGIKYDSDEAISFADVLYKTFRDAAYEESIEMAKERGPFPAYDKDVDFKSEFVRNLPDHLQVGLRTHGRRNIALLTNAPTGSVSIASRTSSGVEAVFRWVMDRYVKITHTDLDFPVDRVDATGDKWTKFRVMHPAVFKYFEVNGIEPPSLDTLPIEEANKKIQDLLPSHFVTSDKIDYIEGVKLQGTIQKYIDHGISRTINLPKGSTKNDVHKIYMQGWKLGLKGITVYVDGSRDGVLVTETKKKQDTPRPTIIMDSHAPKRPNSLNAEIHHVKVKGQDWAVIVGMYQGRPYEIFGGANLVIPPAKKIDEASIVKKGPKRYALEIELKDGTDKTIKDLKEIYDNTEQRVITRSVCRELRHGVPIEFIVRDLQDHEGALTDYSSVLARVLKKYITRPNLIVKLCPDCGGKNFDMVDGCISCKDCGSSKCN